MPTETELKLQVPAAAHAAVRARVGGRMAQTLPLRAWYLDTPDGRLAAASVALRLRLEGRQWVQTVKCGPAHGLTRMEHNAPVPANAERDATGMPRPDPQRHAGTQAGDALLRALGPTGWPLLQPQYGTDVHRLQRRVSRPGARLELALDTGWLRSGNQRQALCELEIELVAGLPTALLRAAEPWVREHGLWLDVRSKAERGSLLARGLACDPAVKAQTPTLRADQPLGQAWAVVLQATLAHALPNVAQVASGVYHPDHVHQLRVALRRLRAATRLFQGLVPPMPTQVDLALRVLFTELGGQRDLDVLTNGLLPEMLAAGLSPPRLPSAVRPGRAPLLAARSVDTNLAWLALLAAAHAPAVQTSPAVLLQRLERWHSRARDEARGFAQADDEARHELRKRLKRLRYGLDLCAGLLPARALATQLRALAEVQDALGRFNDICTAATWLAPRASRDRAVPAALAWLAHERQASLAKAATALQRWRPRKPLGR